MRNNDRFWIIVLLPIVVAYNVAAVVWFGLTTLLAIAFGEE